MKTLIFLLCLGVVGCSSPSPQEIEVAKFSAHLNVYECFHKSIDPDFRDCDAVVKAAQRLEHQ